MKILERRKEQFIIINDLGNIETIPTGIYYNMRYFDYNNSRIHYIFGEDSYVFETYDNRIFNIVYEGQRLQLRQDLSDQLVRSIKKHQKTKDALDFVTLFYYVLKETPFMDILDVYLRNFDCVVCTDEGYVIHDDFLIDFKGNAWIRKGVNDLNFRVGDNWSSLCIVMKGDNGIDDVYLPDGTGKITKINSLTMTIITKVMFLVSPNMKDNIFTGQLPENLKIMLNSKSGGDSGE